MGIPVDHPFAKSWDQGRRDELKSGKIKGQFAGPGESFPISGPEDVMHAWDLAGHAANPQEVRRNIMRIAKEHGWEHGLPGTAKDEMEAHEGARETMKAVVKGYQRVVGGKVIQVKPYADKRGAAMKSTMHAAGATKEANASRTRDAHLNAAKMHAEAAKAHGEAHEAAPHEVKEDHASLGAHHKMLSNYHAGMADMVGTQRDFLKAHVKSHYRFVNGKSVYVKDHDTTAPHGTEATLQQRTQVAKHVKTGDLHLRAFDADDRDAVLEHAKKLGIDATVKRQAGHLHYDQGGKGDHAFYQIHAGSDENAMKLHHALGANKKVEADKASDLANEASDKASDASAMLDGANADPSKHHLAAHDAHTSAVLAHHEAMLSNKEVGNKEMASYHDEKSKGHAKLADEHMAKHKEAKETPKPEPTEKEKAYLENSNHAAKSGKKANELSSLAKEKGIGTPVKEHEEAAKHHEEAASSHYESAKLAPSKELEEFHKKKLDQHTMMKKLHEEGAYGRKRNDAMKASGEANDAAFEAHQQGTAEAHEKASQAHEHAMNAHETARSAAEQKIDNGDKKKATKTDSNFHSVRYEMHGQHGLYHHSAANAIKASEKANADGGKEKHEAAAMAHSQASNHAKAAGFHEKAQEHGEKAIEHSAKAMDGTGAKTPEEAKANDAMAAHEKAHKEANEASKKALNTDYISHEHADSHIAVKTAYDEAASAHAEAVKTGHAAGKTDEAKEHAKQMNDFSKRSDYHKAALNAVYASKAAEKNEGTPLEKSSHDEARAAHHEAAEKAIIAHGHNSDTYNHHIGKAVEHGKKSKKAEASQAASNNSGKELDAKKPFAEQNFHGRSQDAGWASEHANETGSPADHETAAKAHKHAAVIAHHKGMTQEAGFHAAKAKEHEAKSKGVMKSVDEKAASAGLMHAARLLLRQSNQPKNFSKALSDLPAMGGLRDACLKATAAGITDPGRLIELALGGKQQAIPVLAILTSGTGQ